ncbi:MAG TPA: helix-turn-helix domain-containing protein [Cyclobacteriaceae bacterium]|nr:helix-turn-helix domain-containing protein [Cyclobacteriaceae bacterium]
MMASTKIGYFIFSYVAIGFPDIIILLGCLQGIVVSAVLFFHPKGIYATRLLSVLTLIFALACLNLYLLETDSGNHSLFIQVAWSVIPLLFVMPVGPLILFYIKALNDPDFRLTRKHLKHFYPLVIDLVPSFVMMMYWLSYAAVISKLDEASAGNFVYLWNKYADIPRWISTTGYTIMAMQLVRDRGAQIGYKSWARQFVYVFIAFEIIWLGHLIPYLIPGVSDWLLGVLGWYPVYIPMVFMVYWLGVNGLLTRQVVARSTSVKIDNTVVANVIEKLESAMVNDQLYLNPTLNVSELARHINQSSKVVSAVINQQLGKSYNEFVNQYRIEEVKKRLLSNTDSHLTISGIALECGFNSQATFQRVFKQMTGQAPTEFLSAKSR